MINKAWKSSLYHMLQIKGPLYFSFQGNYVILMDNNFPVYMLLLQDCCPGNGMFNIIHYC